MKRIIADFNSWTPEGWLFARLARASAALADGESVLIEDMEGNIAYGDVVKIDTSSGVVYLAPDMGTFSSQVEDSDDPFKTDDSASKFELVQSWTGSVSDRLVTFRSGRTSAAPVTRSRSKVTA